LAFSTFFLGQRAHFCKKTQKTRAFSALKNRPPNGAPAQSALQKQQGRDGHGGCASAGEARGWPEAKGREAKG
jgi:hypothetical protein